MPECYIRGSTIKYLRIPDEVIDMVKEEVIMKSKGRGEGRGRGGQRGRGGRGESLFFTSLILFGLSFDIHVLMQCLITVQVSEC